MRLDGKIITRRGIVVGLPFENNGWILMAWNSTLIASPFDLFLHQDALFKGELDIVFDSSTSNVIQRKRYRKDNAWQQKHKKQFEHYCNRTTIMLSENSRFWKKPGIFPIWKFVTSFSKQACLTSHLSVTAVVVMSRLFNTGNIFNRRWTYQWLVLLLILSCKELL